MERVCLIVLDGWGINPRKEGNAIALASTPNIDRLVKEHPTAAINTSGASVGLPPGQMGNSEVGHLTMGAGRVIYQDLERIGKAISGGEFSKNPVLAGLIKKLKSKGGALHLMGLLSDGGVHSHMEHLYALIDAAGKAGLDRIHIHAFLDGRDTPPKSGMNYMGALLSRLKEEGVGSVATVSGRYYAMDRDNRWERVERAYRAIVEGEGIESSGPMEAISEAYARGETDEFVKPAVIAAAGRPPATVSDGDGVIFFNFRADRARELTKAFTLGGFDGFRRDKRPRLAEFACMTEYDAGFNLPVLFKPHNIENILGEVLSKRGVKQFRVSETEKYAHVTFFFNGGREKPFPGEERLLIPSIKDVATYDKKPQMRACEIADAAVEKINSDGFSFMLMNLANGDMVGHTGILDAAIKACEAVDEAVGRVVNACMDRGWAALILSDHGNAEQMIDPGDHHSPYTAHTTNLVPLILVDENKRGVRLADGGLEDIAPTVLKLMGIEQPDEMTGKPLF